MLSVNFNINFLLDQYNLRITDKVINFLGSPQVCQLYVQEKDLHKKNNSFLLSTKTFFNSIARTYFYISKIIIYLDENNFLQNYYLINEVKNVKA